MLEISKISENVNFTHFPNSRN